MSQVLTLNAGSSSIKFSVYRGGEIPRVVTSGLIDAVGSEDATLTIGQGTDRKTMALGQIDHAQGVRAILGAIGADGISAVGHRIVHGGIEHDRPVLLDEAILDRLDRLSSFAPLHQPHNIAGVKAAMAAFPGVPQIGCFDTAFHRNHPWVNDTFGLPRAYYDKGIRRYGFHGLSYDYIAGELKRIDPGRERCVVAHLGNGASMCAIRAGQSVGSTMGFSALDGLPMGTRCGQLDPGVILYLLEKEGLTAPEISDLLYKRSGLLGISGVSNDMRELEAANTPETRQAIDYFIFRIRRELGAMAAILGGIDTLVFCGGIGEHSPLVRERVCAGMSWLGISIDPEANAAGAGAISTGPVMVRVIPTNEEIVIARAIFSLVPIARMS